MRKYISTLIVIAAVLTSNAHAQDENVLAIETNQISWSHIKGLRYTLEMSTNLVSWSSNSTTTATNVVYPTDAPVAFFRVQEKYGVAYAGVIWSINANIPYVVGQGNVAGKMNWTNANNFCQNLVLGGYSDWRLPTANELQNLLSVPGIATTLGVTYYGVPPAFDLEDYFWSSDAGGGGTYARVRHTTGTGTSTHYDSDFADNYVWAVRTPTE